MNDLCTFIGQDVRQTLEKCVPLFKDQPNEPAPNARLSRSIQRGTVVYQVIDLLDKKVTMQTNYRQFGSAYRARFAAEILLMLYEMGRTTADMRRCKVAGVLGVLRRRT